MYCKTGTLNRTTGDSLSNWYVEVVNAAGTVQPIYGDASLTPIINSTGVASRAKADKRGNYFYYITDGEYYEKYYDANGVYQWTSPPFTAITTSGLDAAAYAAAAQAASVARYMPNKFLTRRVMSSPPTITYTGATTHTMGSYTQIQACDGTTPSSTFNYRRMSKVIASGGVVYDRGCTNGLVPGASTSSHMSAFAFSYDAATLELQFINQSQKLWFKVDGEYVSLTPTTMISDGALGIIYIDFGSAKMREIEVILVGVGQILRFVGAFIEPTASIAPVAPRGPKTFVIGDSFGEGTGATSPINCYTAVLADTLGWDDVVTSSTGGAGLLATNSGTKLKYRDRVAADVLAFSPEIIIIQGSINDGGGSFTAAAITSELASLISEIQAALPLCKIIVTSMMAAAGGGFASPTFYRSAEALKTAADAAGVSFVNLLEQDLPDAVTGGTITRVAAASATRIYTSVRMKNNTSLKFTTGTNAGTHYRVTLGTASGSGDFICDGDRCYSGAAIGDAFVVVGNSHWSGNGKVGATTGNGNCDRVVSSDGTHPSDDGHIMIGTALAYGVAKSLAA